MERVVEYGIGMGWKCREGVEVLVTRRVIFAVVEDVNCEVEFWLCCVINKIVSDHGIYWMGSVFLHRVNTRAEMSLLVFLPFGRIIYVFWWCLDIVRMLSISI
jgi:hypothetical protein